MNLSLKQKIELFLRGRTFLRMERRPNCRGELPIYAFKCPEHGLVEDYPHGYAERLYCPFCGYMFYMKIIKLAGSDENTLLSCWNIL